MAASGWFWAASAEQRDVALEAVVAAARVREDVAVDAARVREEVAHREPRGHVPIGELQLRQHVDDRRVEVEFPLVDELHHERRRPDLRHRADLEDGVLGRLDAGFLVQQPIRRDARLVHTVAEAKDAEDGTGYAVTFRQDCQPTPPCASSSRAPPGAACAGMLLQPIRDAAVEVATVRRPPVEDEQVTLVRVEDERGRHASLS